MIDVHCHLFKEYFENPAAAVPENFEYIVNTADSAERCAECLDISKKFDNVYFTAGIHPHNAGQEQMKCREIIKYLDDEKCAAVGEIGLDYFYEFSDKKTQKKVFDEMIKAALDYKKNIVVHSRAAENDVFEILESIKNINVLIHCYTGAPELLEKFCGRDNFYFSVGGMITFKKNRQFTEYLKIIPLNRLLIESDAPYLAPVPLRGRQNKPEYVSYTYAKISELLNIEFTELEKQISKNFACWLKKT